jgi:hypothetical protein
METTGKALTLAEVGQCSGMALLKGCSGSAPSMYFSLKKSNSAFVKPIKILSIIHAIDYLAVHGHGETRKRAVVLGSGWFNRTPN